MPAAGAPAGLIVGHRGYTAGMSETHDDHPDQQPAAEGSSDRGEADRAERSRRQDPEAPGNYVDDKDADEVPEPNEPA